MNFTAIAILFFGPIGLYIGHCIDQVIQAYRR